MTTETYAVLATSGDLELVRGESSGCHFVRDAKRNLWSGDLHHTDVAKFEGDPGLMELAGLEPAAGEGCRHTTELATNGHGSYCRACGETLE